MIGASESAFGSPSESGSQRLPTPTDLLYQLASRAVTSDTLVRRPLHAINASQSTLNAFRVVLTESALAEAAAADRSRAAGDTKPKVIRVKEAEGLRIRCLTRDSPAAHRKKSPRTPAEPAANGYQPHRRIGAMHADSLLSRDRRF